MCLLVGQTFLNGQTLRAERQAGSGAITIEGMFARYDVDKNGLIERDECVCAGSKLCDLNKDGKVSPDEFSEGIKKYLGSHDAAIQLVAKQGGIEKFYTLAKSGELQKLMNVSMDKVFAQWDRNKSGFLEAGG